ncbi:hypothetical protein RVR_6287 [Actinacidiphila reveromycinica]|uniref:Uncharacterized protein n=1 Tax=Actinacidiphila reveromycinica TaxID=659352 RepID=A0A7U3VQ90_9ACTN|nr:hypothetical protein RVR_6287 [Streptomyces sp. SN-593]
MLGRASGAPPLARMNQAARRLGKHGRLAHLTCDMVDSYTRDHVECTRP